jgi:5-methylcytosine-specific restriction endonuclease McrA
MVENKKRLERESRKSIYISSANKLISKKHSKRNKYSKENDIRVLQKRIFNTKYKVFLRSRYWRVVRELILDRDNFQCVKCSSRNRLEVHHLTYEHHYHEHLHQDDMITVCDKCHHSIHFPADTK